MAAIVKAEIKKWLFAILIVVSLTSLSVWLVVNSPFLYYLSISWFHIDSLSGLSKFSLMRCYCSILSYLQTPWNTSLRLLYFKSSQSGLVHFSNVKSLILLNNFTLLVSFPLLLKIMIKLFRNGLLWQLELIIELILTGLIILSMMIMIDFQAAFIEFHRLAFRNHDWVFHVNQDPIIQVLPGQYFAICFAFFILILFLLLLGLLCLTHFRANHQNYFK